MYRYRFTLIVRKNRVEGQRELVKTRKNKNIYLRIPLKNDNKPHKTMNFITVNMA